MSRPEQAVYDSLGALLTYPDTALTSRVDECLAQLTAVASSATEHVARFQETTKDLNVDSMQELYTRTFEINPLCALEVGWHLFGERYERGTFIVKMRQTLRDMNIPESTELPDHLVHVLQALGHMETPDATEFAQTFVGPAVDKMLTGLGDKETAYREVLAGIRSDLTSRYGQPAQGENHV